MEMSFIMGYVLIFVARVIDVTLGTMRTLMVVQGRKAQSAIIGFFEITIYIVALGEVVNNLDNIGNLLAYGLGFACGNYIGIMVENKIAFGTLQVQVILKKTENMKLIEALRENDFAITVVDGQGREGNRVILNLIINRKDLKKLKKIVYNYDDNAFIISNIANPVCGGYFSHIKKK